MSDEISIITQVQFEERQASNAQREARHFQRNIQRLRTCVLPAFQHRKRRIGHDCSKVRQALVVEGGLHECDFTLPLATLVNQFVAELYALRPIDSNELCSV